MEGIEKHLLPTRRKRRRKVVVLHGLGGIGKTQLSIEFARRHQLRFSAVIWLDGRSEDRLRQSITTVASRIPKSQIPESSRRHLPQNTTDIDTAIKDVLAWLSAPENNTWLVVFDNVDKDYRDLQHIPDAYDVKRYIPSADHGSVLITTRLVNLGQLGTPIQVSRVDGEQALAIFKNGYRRDFEGTLLPSCVEGPCKKASLLISAADSAESNRLLGLLDGLPLALAQASTFMRETATSFAEYIEFYKAQWGELMGSHDSSQAPLQEYQNGSVWTTWTISYQAIQQRDKMAANLLLLWACLDNKDLWFELLVPAYRRLRTEECIPEWFRAVASSKLTFTRTVKLLLGYSLVEGTEGLSSYATHPIVHEWAWQMQEEDARAKHRWLSRVIIGMAVPHRSERDFSVTQRRLLPHADRCVGPSLGGITNSYDMQRHSNAAILTFDALHSLGNLYADQGKLGEAEKMYQRALQGKEKALSAEHTSTLQTVNNLGILYRDQGKLGEAEKMYQRALQGREKALGAEHTLTLDTVHNLGLLYVDQGKLGEAEKMYQRALQGYEKALGAEHTSTLETVNNLGSVYKDQGRLGETEKMYQRALQGYEKALGAEHTSTLETINNLGNLYMDQGKLGEAEKMYQRALQGKEKALGTEHTSTLATVGNLGILYRDQGKLGDAEKMYQQALQGYEKALGAEHTLTLQTVNNLGILYRDQGKLGEAEKMYQRALQGYEKALGAEHTSALQTVNNLGILYRDQGKLGEAEKMYQRALQGYEKALGPESVMTYVPALNSFWGLGALFHVVGNFAEARGMYSKALVGYEKVVGHDHRSCQHLREMLSSLDDTANSLLIDTMEDLRHKPEGQSSHFITEKTPSKSKRHKLLRKLGLR
jgi:tetratricopeptide (TPR) repeat protein